MSEPELYLEELEIHRMPGFPPTRAFGIEDLASGINVIHGPNASGKTTVAEAVTIALHGASPNDGDGQATLRGRLATSDGPYEVKVDAGQRSFLKNGEPDPGPTLAPTGTADRYKLWLHELLQAADPNEDFAEAILEQSTGGYNLRKIRNELRSSPSSSNISERREVNRKRDALQEIKREVVDPSEIEAELRDKRQQAQELKTVQRRAAALEKAKSYREHQADLQEAIRRLEELPDALEDVSGHEPETLETLEDELDEAKQTVRDEQTRIEDAQETLEEVDLPDEDPPGDLIPTLRDRVQDLAGKEDRIDTLEEQANKQREKANEARKALGDVTDPDELEDVDTELVQRAEKLAEEVEQLNHRKATLAAVEDWLSGGESPADPADVQEAIRALRRWLAEPGAGASTASEPDSVATVASILTALVGAGGIGLMLAGLAGTPVAIGGAVVLVAGLVLLFRLYRTEAPDGDGQDARETYERDFQRTPFRPPEAWSRAAVEGRLDEIEETLVEVKLVQEREQQRIKLAPDPEEVEEEEEALEDEAEALAAEIGVALDLEERSFLWFVRNLADWQSARTELAGAEAQLEEARDQRDKLRERIEDALEPYGYETPEDAAAARARIADLDERFQTVRSAKKTLEEAREAKRKAKEKAEATQDEIDAVFEQLGLEPGDEAGLQRLVDRLVDHDDAASAKAKAKPLREQALKELREEPGYEEAMEELGETEIDEQLDELEGELDRLDDLAEAIPKLEERISNAKQEERVEAALEERDRALAALRDKMEQETAELVRRTLAEHVHEITRDQDRPPVFHRARELFGKITRGRYELTFSDADPPAFRARDTRHDETKSLEELSSGTRIQLLLAVRLAFVEQQERGRKLPILLDETLANTDDIRARAIIDAVLEIAREGRQVFYLTAQEDEVNKWAAALEDEGEADGEGHALPHRFIDLAEARSLTDEQQAPKVELVADAAPLDEPPAPEGMDHAAYGDALGVPPFDPREDVGAAHLWYLVEDPELLHQLLELGVERWGQLRALREGTTELDALIPAGGSEANRQTKGKPQGQEAAEGTDRRERPESWATIRARAKALEAYRSAVLVGRGQRVDRAVLEDAPGVTENKIDEVAELAERLDGEPGPLLDALERGEVPYFREKQHAKLKAFLEREGYLDARSTLSAKEIQHRVLANVAEEIEEGVVGREDVLGTIERGTGRSRSG